VYLACAAAFIVTSTWEVQHQVFGGPANAAKANPNCAYVVGVFDEAVLRGMSHAAQQRSRGKADQEFEDVVTTPLQAVLDHCKTGADLETAAVVLRYRDAAEATVDAQQTALGRLRSALDARTSP
jgi:hypothetical protein